ncbi:hypothetical protein BDM02DRAFT_2001238 [Thelephora ganbajun]|uniref:Uncharacterized protein n=1 Tax=Thelephora ganbajun TaxID=370292 RepID=A0ACB6ZHX4_THEGA|nr:hypothetical protein BDM02DRAFT_2001238 [Thelephora ganbajun]
MGTPRRGRGSRSRKRVARDEKYRRTVAPRDVNWYIERGCCGRGRVGNEGIVGEGSPPPTRLLGPISINSFDHGRLTCEITAATKSIKALQKSPKFSPASYLSTTSNNSILSHGDANRVLCACQPGPLLLLVLSMLLLSLSVRLLVLQPLLQAW